MKQNPYPGLFVDIEGLDGSGASTQVGLVEKTLREEGLGVFSTKEPTDNIIGGLIRGALSGVHSLPPSALQLLFVADREHHLSRVIVPILEKGDIVISDRYLWSSVAFGSIDVEEDWLLELHRYCFLPDISIFLKVAPRKAIFRIKSNRFDFELFEKEEKMKRVWKNYQKLAKAFPKSITIINGEQPPERVLSEILAVIRSSRKYKLLTK